MKLQFDCKCTLGLETVGFERMKANAVESSEFKSDANVESACLNDRTEMVSKNESFFETKLPPYYETGTIRIPYSGSISLQLAADLLGVRLEYFEKLLNEGTLKSHGNDFIGKFVNAGDFMEFKKAWNKNRREALDGLAELHLQLDPDLNT